jgi:2-polyprenyl-3-methyl-5-hydroxy-6-metoxy-1,4-benzoquinol methylase
VPPDRWNHNIHYHRVLLEALPARCAQVLDVGCGEGLLSVELARVAQRVTGIDLDAPTLALAARDAAAPNVEYVLGDFLTHPFGLGSFDAVVSIATLHHVDAARGLERMKALVRPGGTLALLGLARSRTAADFAVDLGGAVATRAHKLTKTYWEHNAPKVWPPPETYADMRRIAERVLPGVRYRRLVLWRYSLVWTKPR